MYGKCIKIDLCTKISIVSCSRNIILKYKMLKHTAVYDISINNNLLTFFINYNDLNQFVKRD